MKIASLFKFLAVFVLEIPRVFDGTHPARDLNPASARVIRYYCASILYFPTVH